MDIIDSSEVIKDLIDENEMLLVYFGSNNCGVCSDLKPKVESILEKYPKIQSVQVDVEKSVKLSADYNVFTIPVIVLFIEGKEAIREARHIGLGDLDGKISRYYDLLFGESK